MIISQKKVLLWELLRYRSYNEKQKSFQTQKGHNFSRKKAKIQKEWSIHLSFFKLWGLRGSVALAFKSFLMWIETPREGVGSNPGCAKR